MFRGEIDGLLQKQVKLKKDEILNLIEIPPDSKLGDYAFPCFILSKQLKKSPNEIAANITAQIFVCRKLNILVIIIFYSS